MQIPGDSHESTPRKKMLVPMRVCCYLTLLEMRLITRETWCCREDRLCLKIDKRNSRADSHARGIKLETGQRLAVVAAIIDVLALVDLEWTGNFPPAC